jgi:hypothetical protein
VDEDKEKWETRGILVDEERGKRNGKKILEGY